MPRLPDDLHSRLDSLSKDGKEKVLEGIEDKSVSVVEKEVHEEEKKDWEAEVENAETRQDTKKPVE